MIGNAIATGMLGMVSNTPIIGAALKPLTDALSGLFGSQQGGSKVQSAMNDFTNGNLNGDQLFNAVNGSLDGLANSQDGDSVDQLKQFLAQQGQSGKPVDGDKLMQLLQSLQGGSSNSSGSVAAFTNSTGASSIAF